MAKISVKVVLLDNGVFLLHEPTQALFSYKAPHTYIGKLKGENAYMGR